jgi:hypothetical protein
LVNAQQLTAAWQNLTPKFQRDGANGISGFTDWWKSVDQVSVNKARIVELKNDSAIVEVEVNYKQGKKISSDTLRMSLVWNKTAEQWQIDETSRQ